MPYPYYLTWLGHSALHLQIGTASVYVDPYFRENPMAAMTPDVAHADYILLTHGHSDHVGDTVEIARRCDATVVCNPEIGRWLTEQDVKVHAMQLGGGGLFPFGHVRMTYAMHSSSLPDGGYGGNPGGFLLTLDGGEKIYLAGDTGLFGDMRLIGEEGIDLAVLPIGDNYTMGPEDALRAVKMLQPKAVIPVHYATWAIIQQDAEAWGRQVEANTSARAVILLPGQSYPDVLTH